MNKRLVMGKEIKVNWATTSTGGINKTDTNSEYILFDLIIFISVILYLEHFSIFVGDLAPEVDQNIIHEAFAPFGEIS